MTSLNQKKNPASGEIIIYGLLMVFIFFSGILFGGFTNLTGEAREEMAALRGFLNNGIFALGAACAVLVWKKSPARALLAVALLIWKNIGTITWQSGVLLDTALLTALACADSERRNGTAWLVTVRERNRRKQTRCRRAG